MRRGLPAVLLLLSACVAPGSPPPQTPASASAPASAPSGGSALDCKREDQIFGPSIVPREVYASRTGVMASKFSALVTSHEKPLEECGLRTVLKRLATLTCDDGSNPFAGSLQAAHASRYGSMGEGGRCDNIIDRYDVRCRERTYQVHADMYFCAEGNTNTFQ